MNSQPWLTRTPKISVNEIKSINHPKLILFYRYSVVDVQFKFHPFFFFSSFFIIKTFIIMRLIIKPLVRHLRSFTLSYNFIVSKNVSLSFSFCFRLNLEAKNGIVRRHIDSSGQSSRLLHGGLDLLCQDALQRL